MGKRADYALSFEGSNKHDGMDTASIARRSSGGWVLHVKGKPAHSMGVFSAQSGYGAVYKTVRILNAFREQVIEPSLTFDPRLVFGGTNVSYAEDTATATALGKSTRSRARRSAGPWSRRSLPACQNGRKMLSRRRQSTVSSRGHMGEERFIAAADQMKLKADRRTLATALVANLAMFFVGLIGWRIAHSTALLADAFDMLADASGYAVAFLALGGSQRLQRAAARWNGAMLIALGIGVFGEVAHRWSGGADPHGGLIMVFACLSLLVNGLVLHTLRKYRNSRELHLRATWVDTRADVLVNVGVLASGVLVVASGFRIIDLLAATILAVFVIHEGWELWEGDEDCQSP